MNKKIIAVLVALSLVSFWACNKNALEGVVDDDTNDNINFDQTALYTHLADNVIIPDYVAYATATAALSAAVNTYTANPNDANLLVVKDVYITVAKRLQHIAVYDYFGPSAEVVLVQNTNNFPTQVSKIQANITNGTYNLEANENLFAKGIPALDYLLYGTGNTNNFFKDTSLGNKRCTYLKDLTNDINRLAINTRDMWQSSYRTTFIARVGNSAGSTLSAIVNSFSFNIDLIKNSKIGVPLGKKNGGNTLPEVAEAYYSQISVELLKESSTAMKEFYVGLDVTGKNGLGLDDYLLAVKTKTSSGAYLSDAITAGFVDIDVAGAQLTEPISTAVNNNPTTVDQLYKAWVQQLIYVKTDASSALNITISYQDGDGD